MEKFFYKCISNYIKTCSTTPNTGKFSDFEKIITNNNFEKQQIITSKNDVDFWQSVKFVTFL